MRPVRAPVVSRDCTTPTMMAHTTSAPTYAEVKRDSCPRSNLRSHLRLLSGGWRTRCVRASCSECDPARPCGLRAASRVLPPALLHRLIVLARARTRIGRLGVPIALEKETEAAVAPVVAARNGDIDRTSLCWKTRNRLLARRVVFWQRFLEKLMASSFRHCALISWPKNQRRRMLGCATWLGWSPWRLRS